MESMRLLLLPPVQGRWAFFGTSISLFLLLCAVFTDLDYADDAVLFTQDSGRWQADLKRFDEAATTMGLHTPSVKTTLQNIGHGPTPQLVSVDGHPVALTDQFVYLGSTIDSTGYSSTDILRRVGLASSVIGQLDRVWRQNRLSLATKLRSWQ